MLAETVKPLIHSNCTGRTRRETKWSIRRERQSRTAVAAQRQASSQLIYQVSKLVLFLREFFNVLLFTFRDNILQERDARHPCQIKTQHCMGGPPVGISPRYINLSLPPLPSLLLRIFMTLLRVPVLHWAFVYSPANQYRNAVPASQGSYEAPLLLVVME